MFLAASSMHKSIPQISFGQNECRKQLGVRCHPTSSGEVVEITLGDPGEGFGASNLGGAARGH